MKVASLEDKQDILSLGMEFFSSIDYGKYATEDYVSSFLDNILVMDKTKVIVLLEPNEGMLIGQATPFLFGPHTMASEIAWYVTPDKRNTNIGKELVSAFEHWAKVYAGCDIISLTSLDTKVGKFYEKQGYKLYEYAYMKEL